MTALRRQAWVFAIFLLSAVNIRLVGYIRLSELILLALLPVLLVRWGWPTWSHFDRWLFGLLTLHVVAQAGLDMYHHTPLEDSAKRVGSYVILLLLLLTVRMLLMRDDNGRERWRRGGHGLVLALSSLLRHGPRPAKNRSDERHKGDRRRRRGGRENTSRRKQDATSAPLPGRLPVVLMVTHAGWFCSYFLALLIGNRLDGLVVGHPNEHFFVLPWQLGVGMAVPGLVLVVGAMGGVGVARVCLISLLPMSAHLLYMGARSLAFITLAVFLVGCARLVMASPRPLPFDWRTGGAGVVAVVLAVFAGPLLLGFAAQSGFLPNKVTSKTEAQMANGLLISGRSEVFAAFEMVQRRPLVGFGSSSLEPEFRDVCADELAPYYDQVCRIDSIAVHSHLVGSWIEAGILGALFWLFILGASFYVMCRMALWHSAIADLLVFQLLLLSWDVIFSPGPVRVDMALKLTLLMVCMRILASDYRHPRVQARARAPRRGGTWWSVHPAEPRELAGGGRNHCP